MNGHLNPATEVAGMEDAVPTGTHTIKLIEVSLTNGGSQMVRFQLYSWLHTERRYTVMFK